ncbi:probable uridine nucleosidase 2 [Hyposmocoma kahamanoa]|uniref:probable uridine nucleosidase 2 n=1 Tax=Hyposmocoma kahamanoa TaxID=1477025 RepID=UPI000E6D77BF|nr:probable uridine nucleosidase 2 [Hyposmocoma kahamanoa]XP_026323798.1 probable uridine nucleosidase 2 [Hyposmocoma kahamanoa]
MLFLYFISLTALFVNAFPRNDIKIVIDNDAGSDDAIAIFIALLYEKYFQGPEVIALTTGNCNTIEDNVNINNQKILRAAGRQDIPIYRGSNSSLIITNTETDYYFGQDGLGDNNETLTGLVPAQKQGAVETLLELSKKHEGKLILITIGALTNVALAIKLDPEFLQRFNHLYVGAAHVESERYPNPEFNARMDVEAYRILAQYATPDKVTLVPSSQVHDYLDIDLDWRQNKLGKINTDSIKAINSYERVSLPKNKSWVLLDLAVIATALSNVPLKNGKEPDFVTEYKFSKNDIILCGNKRGINTDNFGKEENANVRVAYSFDVEKYKSFLMDIFTAELR